MIDTAEEATCLACGSPIIQINGRGHRRRLYCDDRCRQKAHRQARKQDPANVTPHVTNGDLQQRIAELEQDLAAAHHLIDEYINRKRTPPEWKKQLQERFWQLGKGADWPVLSIYVPLQAGQRSYRIFALNASNELLEWASVALRNRDQS